MQAAFATEPDNSAIPITFATKATWEGISAGLPAEARQFAQAHGFAAKPGACLALPSADGKIAQIVFGLENADSKSLDPFRAGSLPGLLPAGIYRFANAPHDTRLATLAFALGSYRFNRYRKADIPGARLVPPEGVDVAEIVRAWRRPLFWPATSSTLRPTTWARNNWLKPLNNSRSASARHFPASPATTSSQPELSADSRRRHGLAAVRRA